MNDSTTCRNCHGHLALLDMLEESVSYVCVRCGQEQLRTFSIRQAFPCYY